MKNVAAATAVKKLDSNAAGAVKKLAVGNEEGVFHGLVPTETIAFLYQHLPTLNAELIKPVIGFDAPQVTLSVDKNHRRQLGHYKIGRDGLGLKWRISMNVLHLAAPKASVIGVLLHEVLHAVEYQSGKPGKGNYHSAAFIAWCAKLGIPTNSKGHCLGIDENGLFAQYAKKHNLDGKLGLVEKKDLPKPTGSKLKKWQCSCGVNVRVAIADFRATCDDCGEPFILKDKS
jgi:hypothetical protein